MSHPLDLADPQLKTLRDRDRAVLNHNVRQFMVTPSDELYGADGNTWGYLWDTMFAVMAIAVDDAPRAAYLLRNYLAAQHRNGMVPHMVMWTSGMPMGAFVTNVVWQGYRNTGRDLDGRVVRTSPITQPPLMAVAAGAIADALATDSDRHAFTRAVVPSLIAHHDWLYRERELDDDGLVATVHPHETGRDDAPSHVALLHAVPLTRRERLGLTAPMQRLYERTRTDLDRGKKHISERSASDTVLRAGGLAVCHLPVLRRTMRRRGEQRISRSFPYLHFDPGFHAILDRANDELARLAQIAEHELPPHLARAANRTGGALQRFWDPKGQGFRGIDAHRRITFEAASEIGDLLPIFSDRITAQQVAAIISRLDDPEQFGGTNLATVNRRSPAYRANEFWNGPAWPPTTQLTINGLYRKNAAAATVAERLALNALRSALSDDTVPEYRNGSTGEPRGAHQFSWTAALTISALKMLHDHRVIS